MPARRVNASMRASIVLFACGAWYLQRQPELPPLAYAWVLCCAVPAYVLTRSRSRGAQAAGAIALALVACAAGFFWSALRADLRLADALPPTWEGRDIEIIGVI